MATGQVMSICAPMISILPHRPMIVAAVEQRGRRTFRRTLHVRSCSGTSHVAPLRRSGNYHPSLWTDKSVQSLTSTSTAPENEWLLCFTRFVRDLETRETEAHCENQIRGLLSLYEASSRKGRRDLLKEAMISQQQLKAIPEEGFVPRLAVQRAGGPCGSFH
ncbi:hypothetical protein ZIOFF_075534 [Zingiber officinale]|uniref:Uncharacterized protein n=1 Tax=Zingiber officinale TaxID=94328 RepID=A0A8J5C0E8_ZINOF|nr:hypothetical protein ZIOFF_075534 [Zingiber officinale]